MEKDNVKEEVNICDDQNIEQLEVNYVKRYKCLKQNCKKAFSWAESLRLHVKTHDPGAYKFFCDKCDNKYLYRSKFELHKETHNPWRMCSTCGVTLPSKAIYDRHVQRCENKFKYSCDICKKGFTGTTKLVDHIRVHTKEKPYSCNQCDRKFVRKEKLKGHKRRHDGIKSIKCDLCTWTGYDSSDLCHHRKRHHVNIC